MRTVTLTSRIPEIIGELQVKMDTVVQLAAEQIEQGAKSRVPVESGSLRDAIHTEDEPEGVYVVAGDGDVFYGHFVENGTTQTGPRPFIVPATEATRPLVAGMARAVLKGL